VAIGSHISPSYISEHLRLRELLIEAFDGGEVLRSDLWHPCRVPLFHHFEHVNALAPAIAACFAELLSGLDDSMRKAYQSDLGDVVSLFCYAANKELCVVSTLDLPFDRERASRITLPFHCEQEPIDRIE